MQKADVGLRPMRSAAGILTYRKISKFSLHIKIFNFIQHLIRPPHFETHTFFSMSGHQQENP